MGTKKSSGDTLRVKKTKISFLWHMHQPYYRDDLSSLIVMPWVFLHAIKDYYDMPWFLEKYPTIKATFNLVPSLLVQLKEYEEYDVNDRFLKTLKEDVGTLEQSQKLYLIEYLFFSNTEHMIKPLPEYYDLYKKRKRYPTLQEALLNFSDDEFLDLEVLFILSWCGQYLREKNGVVKELISKQRGYTQEDKIKLLRNLSEFIKEIIPFYKKLMDKGQIEITTTPFNHPIAPLLFDIQNAKIANPYTTLPVYEGNLKDDALLQIDLAVTQYQRLFGKKPDGFWPAEGSICYEFLEVLAKRGIRYACSDEEVLYKSGHFSKEDIYKNNELVFKESKINLFFRDKTLSDLIGFTYSGWDSRHAVNDFFARIEQIRKDYGNDININIILDGENAWEHYPKNAEEFFETLYAALESSQDFECSLMSEVLKDEEISSNKLTEIAPGSWINANFDIWIGHKEKNRAWELIFETKAEFEKQKAKLDRFRIEKITKEFLIAQSSDWFWWYGDDHHTDLASTFDLLFRTHLMNIYTLMGKRIPQSLTTPIVDENKESKNFLKKAQNKISPILDGKISSFFEWLGSGEIDLEMELSSMNTDAFIIKKIYLGCDFKRCYLALIGDFADLFENSYIQMDIAKKSYDLTISKKRKKIANSIEYVTDEIMEIAIDKKVVQNEQLQLKLFKNDRLLQLLPLYSKIEFDCLKEIKNNWYI